MIYTLALTAWARLLGYSIHLQHHSYAYIDHRSRLLAAIHRICRDRCVHLVSCPRMRTDFRAVYQGTSVRVVGVASAVEEGVDSVAPPRADSGRLVLGFLGNVSIDKGLDVAVATVQAARLEGIPVELRVAGPVVDSDAASLLARLDGDEAMRWVGPVYGKARDAFLDGLDVFLFPSRYVHESFGLVAWEAMARGVPLLAFRSGCLTAQAVRGAGVVAERDADFAAKAVGALEQWWRDRGTLIAAGETARVVAAEAARHSRRQVAAFCRDIADGVPADHQGGRIRDECAYGGGRQ